jgi:hypothetical protein
LRLRIPPSRPTLKFEDRPGFPTGPFLLDPFQFQRWPRWPRENPHSFLLRQAAGHTFVSLRLQE